jgi:hypothetical protein
MSFFTRLGKTDFPFEKQRLFVRNEDGIKTRLFSSSKTIKIFIENSGEFLSLEGIAFEIWQLLKKPILFEILLKKLKKQYEVSDKELKKDVTNFLFRLQKYGLIKVSNKPRS